MHLSKNGFAALVIIALCLSTGLLAFFYFSVLQSIYRESTTGQDAYSGQTETLLREVSGKMVLVRGLSPPQNIPLKVVTLDWVEENWGRKFAEESSKELKVEEEIYKALFLMPQNLSLAEVMVEQSGATMAAVWEGDLYVVREYFNPFDKVSAERTLAHEIMHLMQEKYFKNPEMRFHDELQAWAALIEGDAGFTSDKYIEEATATPTVSNGLTFTSLFNKLSVATGLPSVKMPESLIELWLFRYRYGESFVLALYKAGGWEKVNAAYVNPPLTTEQILHLEKYLEGESFVLVNSIPLNSSDWNLVKTDRFGEHFIRVMLSRHIPRDDAAKAAEGWHGDNFTYYEKGESRLFTWKIVWDTERDSVEFFDSFIQMMNAVGAHQILASGRCPSNNTVWWKAGDQYVSLMRNQSSAIVTGSTELSWSQNNLYTESSIRFLSTSLSLCDIDRSSLGTRDNKYRSTRFRDGAVELGRLGRAPTLFFLFSMVLTRRLGVHATSA